MCCIVHTACNSKPSWCCQAQLQSPDSSLTGLRRGYVCAVSAALRLLLVIVQLGKEMQRAVSDSAAVQVAALKQMLLLFHSRSLQWWLQPWQGLWQQWVAQQQAADG